jgi:hypothetical protein
VAINKNITAKKHLSFHKYKPIQPTILSDLYILAGNKLNTTCYIGAHGEAIGNKTFTVPNGLTVKFAQPHGYSMAMRMSKLRHLQPVVDVSGWGLTTYNAGDQCPNYHLTKWHGRHSGYANSSQWERAEEDYVGWQNIVGYNRSLTFAFPRNRWYKIGVPLDQVINRARDKFPKLTTFWGLFCRFDPNIQPWEYNAESGKWNLEVDDGNGNISNMTWNFDTNTAVPI